jgi:hypothetical protein
MKIMSGAVSADGLELESSTNDLLIGTGEATGLRESGAERARPDTTTYLAAQRDAEQGQAERAIRGRRCFRSEFTEACPGSVLTMSPQQLADKARQVQPKMQKWIEDSAENNPEAMGEPNLEEAASDC